MSIGKVFKQNPDGSFSEVRDHPGLLDAHDPDACEHPSIQYFPDEYDDDGNRISKHHWVCPDCDFLQVG